MYDQSEPVTKLLEVGKRFEGFKTYGNGTIARFSPNGIFEWTLQVCKE